MGNQQVALATPTTAWRAFRPDDDTVYSPQKYRETEGIKDCTGYTVSGGKGKITGTNDSGVAFSINNNATITYQPGWKENMPTGKYSVEGWKGRSTNGSVIYLGSNMAYGSLPTIHTGYLSFATAGGKVTLDGDNGQRTMSFDAGSEPTVTPEETTKTFLVQSTVTPVQNFAFDGMDDLDEIYEI